MIPKDGSLWTGYDGNNFRVLKTDKVDGHTWIYYIKEGNNNQREYSCYVESFLSRFREIPS